MQRLRMDGARGCILDGCGALASVGTDHPARERVQQLRAREGHNFTLARGSRRVDAGEASGIFLGKGKVATELDVGFRQPVGKTLAMPYPVSSPGPLLPPWNSGRGNSAPPTPLSGGGDGRDGRACGSAVGPLPETPLRRRRCRSGRFDSLCRRGVGVEKRFAGADCKVRGHQSGARRHPQSRGC